MSSRACYLDLDGTLLGRGSSLLHDGEGGVSLLGVRAIEACLRAGVWLPLVLTLAATTLYFTQDLSRAIAVLVVATPTSLVVAGPASVVAAMTVAACPAPGRPASSLEAELARLMGQAWDDELEPFRCAAEGAPVRWLHATG